VGGQILVPQTTLDACGGAVRIDDQMEVMPKGVKEPITIYEVGGVSGPHDLFLPEKVEPVLLPVEPPLPLKYVVISGKHLDPTLLSGALMGLLDETAEVRVDAALERLTNIKIILKDRDDTVISDELYGKVIGKISDEPPSFKVNFTSITPEAREFLRAVQQSGQEEPS